MFTRDALRELELWERSNNRKPLVIRGARQVGKTTLVHQFSKRFEQYLYLNLELFDDRLPFERFTTIEALLQAIFFLKDLSYAKRDRTLIFIDEIQAVPEAFGRLRYFYEFVPEIPLIAAGSMLESLFDKTASYPVGRVTYLVIRPASFPEFLDAIGEINTLEQLRHIPVQPFAHQKLMTLFHTYALIGGMPEIVQHYSNHRDIAALAPLYDSLITSYLEDVEKYASGEAQVQHLRHVIRSAFLQAGQRIKFESFGKSAYHSREMSEALRTVEKVMLLHLIYPVTSNTLPMLADIKKHPRLQVIDTGMLNYFVGIQKDILHTGHALSYAPHRLFAGLREAQD